MRLQAEELIEKPASEVFRFVATEHFQNHPTWDPALLEMTPTSPGPIRPGSTARLVRNDQGRRSEGVITVTAYEPDRHFAATSRFGPFELRQQAVCESVTAERTRLRLTIDTRASGVMRLMLPLLRRQFRVTMTRSLRTIKQQVESAGTR
jgi:polyketide cyclase/dehydrase/lipid transport protein